MHTLEELHQHYMAVRARLNGVPPKPVEPPKIEREPEHEPVPEVVYRPIVEGVVLSPAQQILKEVAEKHEMTISDLKGPKRTKKYVLARHEACYRMYWELDFSLPQIGRLLGNRDHTTILNAVRKHKKRNLLD